MEYTQTQLISAALADPARAPMSLEKIISEEIREFKASPRYEEMLEAEQYYRNRSDVQNKSNDIKERSNTRIEHPAYKRLVDQKVRYLLARPWSVATEDTSYAKALEELFDQTFRRKIRRMGKNAIKDSVSWLQPYIDANGKLTFMVIPATEVVPLWTDSEHTDLDGFIRFYDQVIYEGEKRKVVSRAEYWHLNGLRRFMDNGDGLYREEIPEDGIYPEPHFALGETAYNWESVPIVWVRYNDEELPLLHYVKELIDDYNWQTSVTADVLRDVANFIYVLKNYGGADMEQFVTELRKSLAIQVEGDGGVDKIQADINVDAVMAFLDKQRRDLYDFASAVDTKDPQLGNASGKAIGFRYMDLDDDCADLGAEFSSMFRRLKPFLDTYLQATGKGDYSGSDYDVIFNVDMPIDETEIIANINASASLLSKRTLMENHPWVRDVDNELATVKEEREEAMKEFGEGAFDQALGSGEAGDGVNGNDE